MLSRTKGLALKLKLTSFNPPDANDAAKARQYINNYWSKLERYYPNDSDTLVGLPNKYLVPAYEEGHEFDFNEMYYWDSYFMVQGLLDVEHRELVLGILDNLLGMMKRFHIIPNASRIYLMGRSQPPLLTSFIFDVYDAYKLDNKWLKSAISVAKNEYETVWMGQTKPHWRQVYSGLSRYYDVNMLHDLAEAESGWDMTPRFGRRALDYLPIDLNALLYKYEIDFARSSQILGDKAGAKLWQSRAKSRKESMEKLMWDRLKKLYYDYNFVKQKRGGVASLAAYFPMWAGMVDEKRANQLVKCLRRFEEKGGLATTDISAKDQLSQFVPLPKLLPTQWAYPNGWAPLHFIVVKALERYGYHDDAKRIAQKWLKTNLDWFDKHGVFLEKYNVVQPDKPPVKGVYPSQVGFGWTNAVFERFCKDYLDT